ncbi:hypothetical protein MMC30_009377, partial [Trapelia coarctata]|nr:hypothetical protein [Trapelia coarctata]
TGEDARLEEILPDLGPGEISSELPAAQTAGHETGNLNLSMPYKPFDTLGLPSTHQYEEPFTPSDPLSEQNFAPHSAFTRPSYPFDVVPPDLEMSPTEENLNAQQQYLPNSTTQVHSLSSSVKVTGEGCFSSSSTNPASSTRSRQAQHDLSDSYFTSLQPTNSKTAEILHAPSSANLSPIARSTTTWPSTQSLESRFEGILDAVEEAGFDSIESMAVEYYSANFKPDAMPHWAQSHSRSRSLRRLLAALYDSARDWSREDARGYREEILRSAEGIYCEEVLRLSRDKAAAAPFGQKMAKLKTLLEDQELAQEIQQDRKFLRQQVSCLDHVRRSNGQHPERRINAYTLLQMPETWSLLSELVRKSGMPWNHGSVMVYTVLHLLSLPI